LQNRSDIRAEVIRSFQYFAVFAVNGFTVRPQLAHVAGLNGLKNLFNDLPHSVDQKGSAQNVQLIAQSIGYFCGVALQRGFQIFVVFLCQKPMAQACRGFIHRGVGMISVRNPKCLVKFFHRV